MAETVPFQDRFKERPFSGGAVFFSAKIIFGNRAESEKELEHNGFKGALARVERFLRMSMVRLVYSLRLLAVIVVSPIILLGIALACLLHPADTFRRPLQRPLRLLMNTADWVKCLPVGYSYWERYQAPPMLDEIAVHHEDSAS
jgi:hypothetical protein